MRRNGRVLATLAVVAGLAACGGSSGGTPRDTVSLSPGGGDVAPRTDPTALLDSWYVDAPGEEDGAALIIGDRLGGIVLFRDCGMLDGDWRADNHGRFIASITGGSGACFEDAQNGGPDPLAHGWWLDVTGYSPDGDDMLLVDAAGQTVARLSKGAHPTTGPDASGEFASPPVLTPELRKSLAEPAALPDGISPATTEDLLGRWIPLDAGKSSSYIAFDDNREYRGSDGCNGVGGRYLVGDDGLLLATGGASTSIGCAGSGLAHEVPQTRRVGLRDGHLVLVDFDGKVIGEARPDRSSS